MNDEMQDEWFELAVSNIHKLIPSEWMPRINEILPKLLKIVKIGIKKNIRQTAESLGDSKMFIMMNIPYRVEEGIIMVPGMFRIDKRQLGPSRLNEETGLYELQLKPGEQPEVTFSMMTLAEKINSYEKIEDLIRDVKDGSFLTLKDLNYKGDKSQLPDNIEQKQISSPNTGE